MSALTAPRPLPETGTFDPKGDCYHTEPEIEITQVDKRHAQGYREAPSA